MDTLALKRQHYSPVIPKKCCQPNYVVPLHQSLSCLPQELTSLFPEMSQKYFSSVDFLRTSPLKVGVLFSGGPAPGGHTVVAALFDALKQIDKECQLIGFLGGASGLINHQTLQLTKENLANYRNQGGFDLLGSGRTKIETSEQLQAAAQTAQVQNLDGLVVIGGDDSNTNAVFLAEYFCQQKLNISVIGIPKTIDGDLKNEAIEVSFGFDTASKIYAEIVGNLARDALSSKKHYFFVKMMGRTASHLTLECALQTQINLALISEEVAEKKHSLKFIVKHIADLICERAQEGKNYGVILIPEGLLEFIADCQHLIKELNQQMLHPLFKLTDLSQACLDQFPLAIQDQLRLEMDSHGNIQLSKVETERLLIALVEKELKIRKEQNQYRGTFNPQPYFCGYEGRAGFPSNFDCSYSYTLGYGAALLVQQGKTGIMCCVQNLAQPQDQWQIKGVPLIEMLQFEKRQGQRKAVIQKTPVYLNSPSFVAFSNQREKWRLKDCYLYPGPLQFEDKNSLSCLTPYIISIL